MAVTLFQNFIKLTDLVAGSWQTYDLSASIPVGASGVAIAMGNSPAPCGDGNLLITATAPGKGTPSIGGWATCFVEEG